MADYYLDHGAYAAQGSIGLNAPTTFGVPQEGDGSSKDAATVASVASVQFTANATGGSSAISVCGITFTATTHFAVGGSLSATLDNLVAAINANSGQGAVAVASGVAVGVPKLCNLVYARKTGTDTLEIMSRVGSATCNNATNSNWSLTAANWTNNGITNFAGGSGGCWGWISNQAAIGVSSSIGALSYGIYHATEMVRAATLTEFDTIWARTESDKTITYSSTAYNFIMGGSGRRLIADTNTKWTGDSGNGKIIFDLTYTANSNNGFIYLANGASVQNVLGAVKRGGFTLRSRFTGINMSVNVGTGSSSGNSALMFNVDLEDLSTVASSGLQFITSHNGSFAMRGGSYSRLVAATAVRTLYNPSSFAANSVKFDGVKFAWNITGLGDPGAPFASTASLNQDLSLVFTGCDFSGWPSGNDKFTVFSSNGATSAVSVQIDNCTGVKITSAFSGLMVGGLTADHNRYGYSYQSGGPLGEFRHEQRNGLTEWDPGYSPAFPTLSATLMDGSTPYSIRAVWALTVGALHAAEFKVTQLRQFNRLSAGARTIDLHLFMRTALLSALTPSHMALIVSYIDDATGKLVTEMVFMPPVASGASWTGAGSWAGYSAYKLSLTTANSVKQNTEIMLQFRILGAVPTAQNESVFIDPDFAVA